MRGLIAPIRGKGPGERKAEAAAFGVGQAQIAPFAALWILLRKRVKDNFACRILGVALDGVDADLPLPAAAIAEQQNRAGQLLLRENPPVAQGNAKGGLFHDNAGRSRRKAG
jgi:hypothetical protein